MTDAFTPVRADREVMPFDVVVVGAGPAGLSAAIRLKQLNAELSVCVLEKGSEVGAHSLSGAVFEPRALNELLPDWREKGAPLTVEAKKDRFLFLTEKSAFRLPTPPQMHNKGHYIISLGLLTRWLAQQAENLGVEIFAGFAAAEVLFAEDGRVSGVATGDMGIGKDGNHTENYTPGVELHASYTLFAEGCRGSCSKVVNERFGLQQGKDPQTYALGVKELWEIPAEQHEEGTVMHSIGWPLDRNTYGGGWLYHAADRKVSVGYVVALDYENPTLSPFQEMQRYKSHPALAKVLKNGRRLSYGARTLVEGGLQSQPKLSFAGGALIGDSAGFLNVPKIKGNHTAMKSGMLAAEAVVAAHAAGAVEPETYEKLFKESWLYTELYAVRNIRPGFQKGLWRGLLNAAKETYFGASKKTQHNHADHTQTKPLKEVQPIAYPKADGVLQFDRLSSVFLSGVNHEENQPSHLKLKEPEKAIQVNYEVYGAPEQYYCPAGVYEILFEGEDPTKPRLQINAQNCVHCKACDIKDPTQNITWTTPEGGGGPNYGDM